MTEVSRGSRAIGHWALTIDLQPHPSLHGVNISLLLDNVSRLPAILSVHWFRLGFLSVIVSIILTLCVLNTFWRSRSFWSGTCPRGSCLIWNLSGGNQPRKSTTTKFRGKNEKLNLLPDMFVKTMFGRCKPKLVLAMSKRRRKHFHVASPVIDYFHTTSLSHWTWLPGCACLFELLVLLHYEL